MDHRFLALTVALAAFCAKPALAGYAQANPPQGWTAGGGTGGSFTGTRAANATTFLSSTVSTNASLNVGGRTVTLPVNMRYAANASRLAASAIMLHPVVRTVSVVGGWLMAAGLVYDVTSGLWTVPNSDYPVSDGFLYRSGVQNFFHYTLACNDYFSRVPSWEPKAQNIAIDVCTSNLVTVSYDVVGFPRQVRSTSISKNSGSSCPSGWYVTPAGCVQTPPARTVTPEEAVEEIIKHPMPADVPRHIPEPLPVEQPSFPPVFIPAGDPVPNPLFDPGQPVSPSNPPQTQPGTEVRPAPAPGRPWQVETTPVNRPVTDPSAPPVREPTPLPDGGGGPSGNEPKDPDKTGLCDRYPNIIACQTLEHEEDDTKLPEKEIEFDFNPIPGFQGAKSCPAFPNVGNILGGKQISWQGFCDSLEKLSHLLLAFAWVSAAFILLGRSD